MNEVISLHTYFYYLYSQFFSLSSRPRCHPNQLELEIRLPPQQIELLHPTHLGKQQGMSFKRRYVNGLVTKKVFESILRGHQASQDEIKIDQRDTAKAFCKEVDYTHDGH